MSETPDESGNRLAAWRFRSVCGVDRLDRLAITDAAEFGRFVRDIRANGWIVKATTKLPAGTPAYFFPRKNRFYFDPDRMTCLDMIHERVHLTAFLERGHRKFGPGQIHAIEDEIVAYSHELTILQQAGDAATGYIHYLQGRIEYYQSLRGRVSQAE